MTGNLAETIKMTRLPGSLPLKEERRATLPWHNKFPRTRNGRETEESRSWNMKKLKLLGLIGITSIALANAGWAAGHGGGGGGFGCGGFQGGGGFHGGGGGRGGGARFGGGRFAGGGGFRSAGPGFSGRPADYYCRGLCFTNSRTRPVRSA